MSESAMIDIYQPQTMLAALRQTMPPKRFFLNTFFRNVVTHETEDVQLDIFKGKRRIAAYVNPILDGVVVERLKFETHVTKPAYTKEMTVLRVKDTRTRSIGETPYYASTPEQRAAQLLGEDLAMLEDRLARREEFMCAEAITTGKVIANGADGWNAEVDFRYENGKHIKVLSGTSGWNQSGSDPMKDLDTWRREIVRRCGIAPDYCIVGADAGWAIMNHATVKERLNIINYQMGKVAPASLPDGVSYFGDLMLPSGVCSLYSYDEVYTSPETGEDVPLVPADMVILGSSQARCEMHYGLIQNMHALTAQTRFPHIWTKPDGSARFVQLESAPMPNLYQVDAFTVAHVLS